MVDQCVTTPLPHHPNVLRGEVGARDLLGLPLPMFDPRDRGHDGPVVRGAHPKMYDLHLLKTPGTVRIVSVYNIYSIYIYIKHIVTNWTGCTSFP